MVTLASPPNISPCVCELWALGIGVLREREQLTINHRGLVAVARGLCRACGPIVPTEAVRLALLRCFILFERENWLAGLVQHITQQLAGRQDTAGRDDVLFVLVLEIGGFAHQFKCVVNILAGERDPARDRALLNFHFPCPVRISSIDELLMPGGKTGSILFGGGRIAGAGGADPAGQQSDRFREGRTAHGRRELSRREPVAALQPVPGPPPRPAGTPCDPPPT